MFKNLDIMTKGFKIALNLAIFLLFIGFACYIAVSVGKKDFRNYAVIEQSDESFESPCVYVASFELPEEINRFDLYGGKLYISAGQSIYIFDKKANRLGNFLAEPDVRDITIHGDDIYLLYRARIVVTDTYGNPVRQWEACSELSDYCSFVIVGEYVFVTDVENKNICKYTTDGNFVKFIKSPDSFVIPSYSFDIDSWNDTVYCVNSGRHRIESYTLNGDFIAAFGSAGAEAGSFAGCCNRVYISFTDCGKLITSEKGIPRVSCFERNGKINAVWLDGKMLHNGNKASEVKSDGEKLFIAGKNTITIYSNEQFIINN